MVHIWADGDLIADPDRGNRRCNYGSGHLSFFREEDRFDAEKYYAGSHRGPSGRRHCKNDGLYAKRGFINRIDRGSHASVSFLQGFWNWKRNLVCNIPFYIGFL